MDKMIYNGCQYLVNKPLQSSPALAKAAALWPEGGQSPPLLVASSTCHQQQSYVCPVPSEEAHWAPSLVVLTRIFPQVAFAAGDHLRGMQVEAAHVLSFKPRPALCPKAGWCNG